MGIKKQRQIKQRQRTRRKQRRQKMKAKGLNPDDFYYGRFYLKSDKK